MGPIRVPMVSVRVFMLPLLSPGRVSAAGPGQSACLVRASRHSVNGARPLTPRSAGVTADSGLVEGSGSDCSGGYHATPDRRIRHRLRVLVVDAHPLMPASDAVRAAIGGLTERRQPTLLR